MKEIIHAAEPFAEIGSFGAHVARTANNRSLSLLLFARLRPSPDSRSRRLLHGRHGRFVAEPSAPARAIFQWKSARPGPFVERLPDASHGFPIPVAAAAMPG